MNRYLTYYQSFYKTVQALLAVILFVTPALALNRGASVLAAPATSLEQVTNVIDPVPSWFSEDIKSSTDLAWGDVDGDGDLDLAVTSSDRSSVIYYNQDGYLDQIPGWSASYDHYAVAWGDVDNDGDLDLALGGDGGGQLYLNNNGVLEEHQRFGRGLISSLAWGDLNNDGLLDITITNNSRYSSSSEGDAFAYLNNGGRFEEAAIWDAPFESGARDVALGDMDGDGDLDIVVGMREDHDFIYWNDDGIISSEPTLLPNSYSDTYSVALGDVDNDGDLDIAVGRREINHIYLNTGEKQFDGEWWSDQQLNTENVVWGDLDNDGDLDLIADADIYLNQNGTVDTTASTTVNKASEVALGDVNGDGYLDLGVTVDAYSKVRIHLNQTSILREEPDWTSTETSKTECVALGDANGDDVLDLAVGNEDGLVQVYLSDGTLKFSPNNWQYNDDYETLDVVWGDVDNDGDLDLVTGNANAPNQLYENVDGVLRTPPIWTSNDADETVAVDLGDIDGDGDLDLIAGNDREVNKIYRNEYGTLPTIFTEDPTWHSSDDADTTVLTWVDMDNDGDLDLAEGSFHYPTHIFINVAGQLEPDRWATNDHADFEAMDWGDLNGDGLIDLAASDHREPARVYLNIGNGVLNKDAVWTSDPTDDITALAWADVDGDGDLDLALGNDHDHNKLYLNVNGILESTPIWSSADIEKTVDLAWGDMDGDGDLDLAAANEISTWSANDSLSKVYRNDNGVLTTDAVWNSDSPMEAQSVAWADIDLDGDFDLAIGVRDEPNRLFLSNGTVLEATPAWITNENDPTRDIAWGDLNGDSYPDLAVANWDETANYVYLNNGNGTFPTVPSWQTLETEESTVIEWADFDQDGDDDLIVGNLLHSTNLIYFNNNGVLEAPNWSFGGEEPTYDIDVVDVDNDGDLDITMASSDPEYILYRNHENQLVGREWYSGEAGRIETLAWGDVDNDGDLDLAVGSGKAALYLNENGILQRRFAWTAAEASSVYSLDWGDMNGDGFLDLAVGNRGQSDHVYLNFEGQLEMTPSWISTPRYNTASLAWADVNGDGLSDLAVGSSRGSEPVHIYLNQDGMLETVPSWVSVEEENDTYAIAWGDVNQDGNPDLAIANDSAPLSSGRPSGPNRIYMNHQGILHSGASWENADNNDANCLAWGDVDGDNDLDLAVAFDGGPNKVFYNIDGTIQRDHVWSSNDADESEDVAWGDIDGDGDLDLAVSNDSGPSKVYRNSNGTLERDAFWVASDDRDGYSIAWGDVDSDGDLDLAVSTRKRGNRVYLNLGKTLETTPSWISEDDETTSSVAWGDINGDGWLDLVAGNNAVPNKVYFNEGGALQKQAGWLSNDDDHTQTVVLKDMDNDGDLDLVAGNSDSPHKIYFNINGELEKVASWVSTSTDPTWYVAVGDIDGDGDNDIVTGNHGQPNTIHLNPLRRGSQQANAPVYVSVSRPVSTHAADFFSTPQIISSATIPISYKLFANINTTVRKILPEYSLDGGGIWRAATQVEGTQSLNSLSASPSGTEHTFLWDVKADRVIKHDSIIFRVRAFNDDTHSPILWPAQDGKTLPFRIEDPWYIKIIDEENGAMEGGVVYVHGEYLSLSNRAGLVGVDNPFPAGTPLVALAIHHEQAKTRIENSEEDWAYRVVTMNREWNGSDFVLAGYATDSGRQTLTVQKEWPLILFNLVVSIEWNATDAYLAEIESAMRHASNYLYDVTNGQMAFGEVKIFDARERWNSADIQINTQNIVRPHAYIGGIHSNDPNHVIHLGRHWDGASGNQGSWSEPVGYRTITHEFMHYAVSIYDEYFGFRFNANGDIIGQRPTYCTGPENRNPNMDHSNSSMMDYQYTASELSSLGISGSWSALCEETAQWQLNGGSAWDTLVKNYSDIEDIPRWQIMTPTDVGHVIEGPSAIPEAFPQWPEISIETNNGSPIAKQLIVRNAEGQAYRGVNVTLQKQDQQIIEQGFTDGHGNLLIYGAEIGDKLRISAFQKSLSAQHTIGSDGLIEMELR